VLAREESHSVSGLLLARRDKGVTAEPAGLKEAAFGPSRPWLASAERFFVTS
jgi:hypothetical protein